MPQPASTPWEIAGAASPARAATGSPFAKNLAAAVTRWWQARVPSTRHLSLVESLTLGPKRSVALFELDGQRFLAGMGADGVTTLLQVQPATTQKADQP